MRHVLLSAALVVMTMICYFTVFDPVAGKAVLLDIGTFVRDISA